MSIMWIEPVVIDFDRFCLCLFTAKILATYCDILHMFDPLELINTRPRNRLRVESVCFRTPLQEALCLMHHATLYHCIMVSCLF